MVVAFDHPRPDAETTQLAITTRFTKLASKTQFKDIEVESDGNTVILRGAVDSERTSRLATILARMEPGVKRVQNELTVAESPSPAPSSD
jgi:osmotically-inducible protein OsmY